MTDNAADSPVNRRKLERVWRCFDESGRLQRWPNKRSEQLLVLWIVWSQLPADTRYTEAEISSTLRTWHDFDDHVLLRRELVDLGLLQRTQTGSIYRRTNPDVPADAAAAIAKFDAEG